MKELLETIISTYILWVWLATWGDRTLGDAIHVPAQTIIGWFA